MLRRRSDRFCSIFVLICCLLPVIIVANISPQSSPVENEPSEQVQQGVSFQDISGVSGGDSKYNGNHPQSSEHIVQDKSGIQHEELMPLSLYTECEVVFDILLFAGKLISDPCNDHHNCCVCHGVACESNHVVSVELTKLSGILPPSIWSLQHTKTLVLVGANHDGESPCEDEPYCFGNVSTSVDVKRLTDNQLTGRIPEVGGNVQLPSLSTLVLLGNFYNEYVPNIATTFPKIERLILIGHWYTDINKVEVPPSIVWLTLRGRFFGQLENRFFQPMYSNVMGLSLFGNFDGELPTIFNKFKQLEVLNLDGQFHGFLRGVGQLSNLQKLYIAGNLEANSSRIFPDEDILQLRKLTQLHLMGNFECHISERIGEMRNLEDLTLSGNFQGGIPPSIGNLASLITLALVGNFNKTHRIPSTLQKLTNLKNLKIIGNFQGQIPHFLHTLVNLTSLNVVGGFTGEIPAEFKSLTRLTELLLIGNFNGSIPKYINTFKNLTEINLVGDFDGSRLDGIFDNLTSLEKFTVVGKFSGSFPAIKGDFLRLTQIRVVGNFEGLLPEIYAPNLEFVSMCCNLTISPKTQLQNLTNITYLDLSNNNVSGMEGIISELRHLEVLILDDSHVSYIKYLSSLANLRYLSLSGNELTNSQYANLPSSPSLQLVDLSRNQFTGRLMAFSRSCGQSTSKLLSVSFANNFFSELVITEDCPFESLAFLDLSDNRLKGMLPSRMPIVFPNLISANFSNNFLNGTIPESFVRFLHMDQLDVRNNADLHWNDTGNDKSFIQVTNDISVYRETLNNTSQMEPATWYCQNLKIMTNSGNYSLVADDKFQNYFKCKCQVGFYGVPNHSGPGCISCDTLSLSATCPGDGGVYATQGYWLSPPLDLPNSLFPKAAIPCIGAGTSDTVCSPDPVSRSGPRYIACEDGYTGRLCSKCEEHRCQIGGACIECLHGTIGRVTFGVLLCIMYCLIIAMGYSRIVSSSGTVRVLIVFTQSLYYIVQRRAATNLYFPAVLSVIGHWNIPGPSCYIKSWNYTATYICSTVFPLILLLGVAVTYIFGEIRLSSIFRHSPAKGRILQRWGSRSQHAAVFVIYFGYVGFSSEVVRPITCQKDPGTGKEYMMNIPYERCSTPLRIFSSILIVLFVLGIPAWVVVSYRRFGKPKRTSPLDLLSKVYSEETWMWELFVTGRRMFIIVAFLAIGMNSPFQSLVVFSVLGSALALQSRYSPFRGKLENLLESISLVLLMINYGVILQYGSPATSSGLIALYCVFSLDAVLIGTCVVEVLTEKISALKRWYLKKYGPEIPEGFFGLRLLPLSDADNPS